MDWIKFSIVQVHRTDINAVAKTVPTARDDTSMEPLWVLIMYTSVQVPPITEESIANLKGFGETVFHIPVAYGPRMTNIFPHVSDLNTRFTRTSTLQGWRNRGYLSFAFWELIHRGIKIEVISCLKTTMFVQFFLALSTTSSSL
jgi:hypothetical protein